MKTLKELKNEVSNGFKESVLKERVNLEARVLAMVIGAHFLVNAEDIPTSVRDKATKDLGQQMEDFNEEFDKYAVGVNLSGVDKEEAYGSLIAGIVILEETLGNAFILMEQREKLVVKLSYIA